MQLDLQAVMLDNKSTDSDKQGLKSHFQGSLGRNMMQNHKEKGNIAFITLCCGDLIPVIKMTYLAVSRAVLPGKYRDWLR